MAQKVTVLLTWSMKRSEWTGGVHTLVWSVFKHFLPFPLFVLPSRPVNRGALQCRSLASEVLSSPVRSVGGATLVSAHILLGPFSPCLWASWHFLKDSPWLWEQLSPDTHRPSSLVPVGPPWGVIHPPRFLWGIRLQWPSVCDGLRLSLCWFTHPSSILPSTLPIGPGSTASTISTFLARESSLWGPHLGYSA